MVRLTIRQTTIFSSFFIYIRVRGSYWQNIYGYAVNDYSVRASVFHWTQKRLGIYQFPGLHKGKANMLNVSFGWDFPDDGIVKAI